MPVRNPPISHLGKLRLSNKWRGDRAALESVMPNPQSP